MGGETEIAALPAQSLRAGVPTHSQRRGPLFQALLRPHRKLGLITETGPPAPALGARVAGAVRSSPQPAQLCAPRPVPQQAVQVGLPWLPPAFPDRTEGVPLTEAPGPFCSPLSRGTISTTVRTRCRGRRGYGTPFPRHEHSPSRLWGPRCLGCPWCQGLPCAPAESGCVGGGPDGGGHRRTHTPPMRVLALGSGGPSGGLQPRSSFSAGWFGPGRGFRK